MPSLTVYPYDKPQDLEEMCNDERRARAQEIEGAWNYYNGIMNPPLKVRAGQPDDNVILNLCGKMIDQSISMLFGTLPTFDITQDAKTDADETILRDAWEENMPAVLFNDMAKHGSLGGHVFVKLLPVMQGQQIVSVRQQVQDPALVSAFWDPMDKTRRMVYRIGWTQGDDQIRQDIVAPWAMPEASETAQGWLVRDLLQVRGSGKWETINEVLWEYPFAPMVDWQNLRDPKAFYGAGDLINPQINDRVNFVVSNIIRIIKYHAHPRTIITGAEASKIQDTAIDTLWAIPAKEAQVFNLEMQSDLASSRALLSDLKAEFYSEHRAVDMSTLKDRLGQLTNFGLRVLFKDALDKLATKRTLYGEGLLEISRRMMALLGQDVRPQITWPKELPYNALEEIEEIRQEMELGLMSKQTAAGKRGRDWETEKERLEEERVEGAGLFEGLVSALELGP